MVHCAGCGTEQPKTYIVGDGMGLCEDCARGYDYALAMIMQWDFSHHEDCPCAACTAVERLVYNAERARLAGKYPDLVGPLTEIALDDLPGDMADDIKYPRDPEDID